jgi:hypothetical protein
MKQQHIEAMERYTHKHVRDPQPGDHFTEHCGSVALIESREGTRLMVRRTVFRRGVKAWGEPEHMSVPEFIRWASYGGTNPGYWLELWPPSWPKELMEGG